MDRLGVTTAALEDLIRTSQMPKPEWIRLANGTPGRGWRVRDPTAEARPPLDDQAKAKYYDLAIFLVEWSYKIALGELEDSSRTGTRRESRDDAISWCLTPARSAWWVNAAGGDWDRMARMLQDRLDQEGYEYDHDENPSTSEPR